MWFNIRTNEGNYFKKSIFLTIFVSNTKKQEIYTKQVNFMIDQLHHLCDLKIGKC